MRRNKKEGGKGAARNTERRRKRGIGWMKEVSKGREGEGWEYEFKKVMLGSFWNCHFLFSYVYVNIYFFIVRNLKAPRAKIKHVTDILEQFVVPVASFLGDNFISQHDNARLHSVRIVSEYLDEIGIASMQWPARSQDLNPIENLWDMMGQRVRAL
jgi:hypothetical protein